MGRIVFLVHVRLIHPSQKHPGVAGKAFHIATLTVRVDGIESQTGLARAGKAGHDDQLFPREGQVDIFQVATVSDGFADKVWGSNNGCCFGKANHSKSRL